MEHSISVGQLKELLGLLEDDDVLIPNRVANLTIIRADAYIGFINLLEGGQEIEMI